MTIILTLNTYAPIGLFCMATMLNTLLNTDEY